MALRFEEGGQSDALLRGRSRGVKVLCINNCNKKTLTTKAGAFRFTVFVERTGETVYEGAGTWKSSFLKTSDYHNSLIPITAVRSDLDGEYVFVLRTRAGLFGEEQFVQRLDITVVERSSYYVSVDLFNLADRVVIATSLPLASGQKVRVVGN